MGDNALFVTVMGIGTVFVGLVCIVIICAIMSAIVRAFSKKEEAKPEVITQPVKTATIPNKQEFIAAVSAVIAEEMGTDITGIRIHSVKQI